MHKPIPPRLGRFGIWLATLLGLAALAGGLLQLWLPSRPLHYEHLSLGALPVTMVAGETTAADAPAVVIAHGFAASRQIMISPATARIRRRCAATLPIVRDATASCAPPSTR